MHAVFTLILIIKASLYGSEEAVLTGNNSCHSN